MSTIIVLLILAGVSLSLVTGTNGILGKAKNSVDTTREASAKEQVELKIAEFQTEYYEKVYVNHEEDVNKKMGEWIAENHSGTIQTADYEFKITSNGCSYDVTILENNSLKNPIVGELTVEGELNFQLKAFNFGEIVTINNEKFYVIEESDEHKTTVKLLAEKVINTTDLKQTSNSGANTVAFAKSNGWSANENLNENESVKKDSTSAVSYAIDYGKKFDAKGRLLTKPEVEKIIEYNDGVKPNWLHNCDNGVLRYWMGTAQTNELVYAVFWGDNIIPATYTDVNEFYVRPVIEISKSKI